MRPLQWRVMEKHQDGSARWVLLDYQADFEPLGDSTVHLLVGEQGIEAPADQRIVTREQGDLLIIENGVLKLEVNHKRCQPTARLWHESELVSEGGWSFWVTSKEGKPYFAGNDGDVRFVVEESGPLRLFLSWEGSHRDEAGNKHFDFIVRIMVYADQPFLRIDHIFINRLNACETAVWEVVAKLPVKLSQPLKYAVADGNGMNPILSDKPVRHEQFGLANCRNVTQDGQVLRALTWIGGEGWASVNGTTRGVLLAGKTFWQNYPKMVEVTTGAVAAHLIPRRDKPFIIPRGMAKTHTFFVQFHHGQAERTAPNQLARAVQRWPMPVAPSEYYLQSGQVWDFFGYYPGKYQQLDVALRQLCEYDRASQPANPPISRAYGLKHYGDYVHTHIFKPVNAPVWEKGPDPDAPDTYYMNNEYDDPHVATMLFLRRGEIAKWWLAEAHALHMMDVDTCHHAVPAPPSDVLHDWRCLLHCQYRHCYQHVGGIQDPHETLHRPAEGSHTFAEGLIDLYRLTGDRRYLDTAEGYARHLSYMVNERGYRWGLGRGSGWALTVIASVYEIRPTEAYRRAADTIIASTFQDGKVISDRGVGLGLRGLVRWHQITGDPRCKQVIMHIVDQMLKECSTPEGMFINSREPENSKFTTEVQGQSSMEILAYCYELTNDRKYIDLAIGVLHKTVKWLNDPKLEGGLIPWQRILRGPFRFMQITHELGLLEKVNGTGGWIVKHE